MFVAGQIIGTRWQVVEQVGEGRWSRTYRVLHVKSHAERALELFADGSVPREAKDGILRDAQLASRLDSPFVVGVVEAGWEESARAPFVVTARPEGTTLAAELAARGSVAPERLAVYFEQLGRALSLAANAGVVHRALRPSCIHLAKTHDGRPLLRLSGFAAGRALEAAGAFARDLELGVYASPELVAGRERVTFATDVWPLAPIAYQALTAQPVASLWGVSTAEEMASRVLGPPPVPSAHAGTALKALPPGFDAWFAECVALDPAHRYSNAEDALQRLRELLAASTPSRPATALGGAVKTFVIGDPGAATAPDATAAGPVDRAGPAAPAPPQRLATRFQVDTFSGPSGPEPPNLTAVPAATPKRAPLSPFALVALLFVAGAAAVAFFVVPAIRAKATPPALADASPADAAADGASAAPAEGNPWIAIPKEAEPKKWLMGIDDPNAPLSVTGERPEKAKAEGDHAPAKPYQIQAHEVTWAEVDPWLATFDARPSWAAEPSDPRLPVTGIPWAAAQAYCVSWLHGDLPSEAQWEYAARGPDRDEYPWDTKREDDDQIARLQGKDGQPVAVAREDDPDRSWRDVTGLFGNAQEWTENQYDDDLPGQEDDKADWARQLKVVRGVPLVGTPDESWTFAYRTPVCATETCDPTYAGTGDASPVLRFRHLVTPVPAGDPDGTALPLFVQAILAPLRACLVTLVEGPGARQGGAAGVGFSIAYERASKSAVASVKVADSALPPSLRACVEAAAARRVDGVDDDRWFSGGKETWRASFSGERLLRTPPDLSGIGFRCVKN